MTKDEAIAAARAAYCEDGDYWDRHICRLQPRPDGSSWVVVAWFGLICVVCESAADVSSIAQWYADHISPLWRDDTTSCDCEKTR